VLVHLKRGVRRSPGAGCGAKKIAPNADWNLGKTAELIDEVTSLVEYPWCSPAVSTRRFSSAEECLIISMQQHQNIFRLRQQGKLLPVFVREQHEGADTKQIIHATNGCCAAAVDAKFFYDQDRKQRLADRLPRLAMLCITTSSAASSSAYSGWKTLRQIAQLVEADMAHASARRSYAKPTCSPRWWGSSGAAGHYGALLRAP